MSCSSACSVTWGSQSWLQPAFSRRSASAPIPKEPPEKAAAGKIACPTMQGYLQHGSAQNCSRKAIVIVRLVDFDVICPKLVDVIEVLGAPRFG